MNQALMQVPGAFQVVKYHNRDFIGDYRQMEYGSPNSDRLRQLREQHRLELVVAGHGTEFEAILALKRWVRNQWDYGWSHGVPADGLEVLQQVAEGQRFTCGQYATVFVECARSLGWPARKVSIGRTDCEFPRGYNIGGAGHVSMEVWSNDYEKWVVMEPMLNGYYERQGLPLAAIEIRDAWLCDRGREVTFVQEQPPFIAPAGRGVAALIETNLYRNDWNDEVVGLLFGEYSRNRTMDYYSRVQIGEWEWVDERCLPSFIYHYQPHRMRTTSQVSDMYHSVNLVRLTAKPDWDRSGSRLTISLEHCMPYFDHFEKRIDGTDWEKAAAEFVWPMHEGTNCLECRAVNVMGRMGPVSSIDVLHARPQLQHVQLS